MADFIVSEDAHFHALAGIDFPEIEVPGIHNFMRALEA
jgi:hypothetical protein